MYYCIVCDGCKYKVGHECTFYSGCEFKVQDCWVSASLKELINGQKDN